VAFACQADLKAGVEGGGGGRACGARGLLDRGVADLCPTSSLASIGWIWDGDSAGGDGAALVVVLYLAR
jgi:hypothetical protein